MQAYPVWLTKKEQLKPGRQLSCLDAHIAAPLSVKTYILLARRKCSVCISIVSTLYNSPEATPKLVSVIDLSVRLIQPKKSTAFIVSLTKKSFELFFPQIIWIAFLFFFFSQNNNLYTNFLALCSGTSCVWEILSSFCRKRDI